MNDFVFLRSGSELTDVLLREFWTWKSAVFEVLLTTERYGSNRGWIGRNQTETNTGRLRENEPTVDC